MGAGDVDVRIVENPTATTMDAAVTASIAATSTDAALHIVNLGQDLMIVTVARS